MTQAQVSAHNPVGAMNAIWIMFPSKSGKVASQASRGDLLKKPQRVCVALFNESPQEPFIEFNCVLGKLSCLGIDQKRIGRCPDIIPL